MTGTPRLASAHAFLRACRGEAVEATPVWVMRHLLPADASHTVNWRRGSKGKLGAQFAHIRVIPAREQGADANPCWLLFERPRSGD